MREDPPAWIGRQFPAPAAATTLQNLGTAMAQVALLRSPLVMDAARPNRLPTEAELKQLEDALDEVMVAAPADEPDAARAAIALAVRIFDIRLDRVDGGQIAFDPDLLQRGVTNGSNGAVVLGRGALINGGPELLVTILHEVTHANQTQLRGDAHQRSQRAFAYEYMAYSTAEMYEKQIGVEAGSDLMNGNRELKEAFLQALTPDNREKLLSDGRYWEFDATEDKTLDPDLAEKLGI
jgi:hypothetical protein